MPAELEKGFKDRTLPISPEFVELLSVVPESQQTGFVYDLRNARGTGRIDRFRAMHIIGEIGRKAGVKVATRLKDGKEVVKCATAHDLRRSFGERWASRVMPQVLKELMRHESIETTLRFYVGRNAQTTAAILWEAHSRIAGSSIVKRQAFDAGAYTE